MISLAMHSLINKLAGHLIKHKMLLASAESCTGGLIAMLCTDVAGSSCWFERGMITYSNEAKIEMLGVKKSTIETYGAVSQQVVEQMALGALKNSHADIAVAVTGIAGPTGGTEQKPVGTVWIAWASDKNLSKEKFLFQGNREKVREQTAKKAIEGLLNIK